MRASAKKASRVKVRIRKGDAVTVIAGKDKGKTGKVLRVVPEKNRVIVEGVNFVKKHARRTREDRAGGIHQLEASVHVSNVMVVCPKCRESTRLGSQTLADGGKVRKCARCGEVLDR
jgi:large subunit ribosomal protein L24